VAPRDPPDLQLPVWKKEKIHGVYVGKGCWEDAFPIVAWEIGNWWLIFSHVHEDCPEISIIDH
jgi:hypothetical protein